MKNLAIIPARSGSKGVPDKNIKELCGKPLLAYTIEAALQSNVFDEVIVSTDSARYAAIAEGYGASVPFLRSKKNAGDGSATWDTVREVMRACQKQRKQFEAFCLLQPTSPLRSVQDIRNAYHIFVEQATVAVVSVCETEHPPLWSSTLNEEHSLEGFLAKDMVVQRQKQDVYYRLNGAIYFVYMDAFLKDEFLYRKGSVAYVMPVERSVDIDNALDFHVAEAILGKR